MIVTEKENIWVWFTKEPTMYSGTTIPQRDQQATCRHVDYMEQLYHGRGSALSSPKQTHLFC